MLGELQNLQRLPLSKRENGDKRMKRRTLVKICYFISLALLLCFVGKTVIDSVRYPSLFTSAPFYVYIILNALYFVLPAGMFFLVGWLINRKSKK